MNMKFIWTFNKILKHKIIILSKETKFWKLITWAMSLGSTCKSTRKELLMAATCWCHYMWPTMAKNSGGWWRNRANREKNERKPRPRQIQIEKGEKKEKRKEKENVKVIFKTWFPEYIASQVFMIFFFRIQSLVV